jgi:Arc/MetJ-type ribon-helix-helix transcriptional regulator
MTEDEITSLTIRLPKELRARIKRRAKAEERSESQFVRFHLAELLGADGEDEVADASEQEA